MRMCRLVISLCLVLEIGSTSRSADVATAVLLKALTLTVIEERNQWVTQQMYDIGYVEGENITFIRLNAGGSSANAKNLLQDVLQDAQVDLVIANTTVASTGAKDALTDTDIPLVFFGGN